ncbi:conserved hypothetical protein [Tenacibaculum sp. 190524A02b]|uniref:Uncharacterized protein n=1 Tax=Tenacibaculum vairaonense TaxID=3137860 RepID=A0ABP1FHR3_9FLAO
MKKLSFKNKEAKLTLNKFQISKIKNPHTIFGGAELNGLINGDDDDDTDDPTQNPGNSSFII